MAGIWLNRLKRTAVCASLALLAACGSGTIESALKPSRFVAFGDAMSDVGQTGARYTVNDGSTTGTWIEQLAASYSLTLTSQAAGGQGYARGNARVVAKPDAAGNAATLTVKEQIDAFLAAGAPGANDVLVVNAGISDIVAEMAAVQAGRQTEAQMLINVRQAGKDLGGQVRRLVQAGAKYVVVVGPYNLGKSPWATALNKASVLESASSRFNEDLLVSIVDLGANVLYVDAGYYLNLVLSTPTAYGLTDSTTLMCTSVDAGAGIGTGAGQINSKLCTTSTIAAGKDYRLFAYADRLYFTPVLNRLFGTYAFDRLRERF